MKAIVEINSKQYIVSENMILDIDFVDTDEKVLQFENVICLYDNESSKFGTPYIDNTTVKANVLENVKSDKIKVFKFKTKTGYKKTQGHRQDYTRIQIEKIEVGA